ncbi:hypothetical protein MtrunA17_Chr7g0275311 [Medicago truncatula]|uniref:Uncharacterized protein n=1 Tax=Medicago truncatula TaxID=3880 RepID=A0A396HAF0_MEDTR|nr:hypothetical protein MtrunA17_Chr7g0275311 [Medicago truncatula]
MLTNAKTDINSIWFDERLSHNPKSKTFFLCQASLHSPCIIGLDFCSNLLDILYLQNI